jgi:hypothetical protein
VSLVKRIGSSVGRSSPLGAGQAENCCFGDKAMFKPDGSFAISLRVLHPESRLRLRIFSFKLLVLIPMSTALALQRGYPVLNTVCFFCFWNSIFAGLAELFQQQKYNAKFLTAWDEMAAFLALALLTRLADGIIA